MLVCVNRFQYILGAATSPAVKVDEEPLTYLNQGITVHLEVSRCDSIRLDCPDLSGFLLFFLNPVQCVRGLL